MIPISTEFNQGVLLFCSVTILLSFLFAGTHKWLHFRQFEQTLLAFQIIPPRLNLLVAILSCLGEGMVILCLLMSPVVSVGFGLAIVLLLLYTGAIAFVLRQRVVVTCNCFGARERSLSSIDLWRNGVLLLCALIGLLFQLSISGQQESLSLVAKLVCGGVAFLFTLTWTRLGEITDLLLVKTAKKGDW